MIIIYGLEKDIDFQKEKNCFEICTISMDLVTDIYMERQNGNCPKKKDNLYQVNLQFHVYFYF